MERESHAASAMKRTATEGSLAQERRLAMKNKKDLNEQFHSLDIISPVYGDVRSLNVCADLDTEGFYEKACDAYCEVCGHYPHTNPPDICRQTCDYFINFKRKLKND